MKTKALYIVLSRKLKDGEIIFVNNLAFDGPKTKEAREILSSLSKIKGYERILNKRKNSILISTDGKDLNVSKSFNNFGNVKVDEVRNLNPLSVLNYKYLLIENPEASLKFIEDKVTPKKAVIKEDKIKKANKAIKKISKKISK